MKKFLLLLSALSIGMSAFAKDKPVKNIAILSVNDMHATIERMPQVVHIADSLREIYPNLLLLSAGDNRTGNPISDEYPESSYPMTALMNFAGFDASTVGNHEFDASIYGFRKQVHHSHFPYLAANIQMADSLGFQVQPYKIFTLPNGVRVGVLGLGQVGVNGKADSHPDNLTGVTFIPVKDAIKKYIKIVRKQCDVLVLLSHNGFDEDVKVAEEFDADLIIGGHSHTLLVNGVDKYGELITQVEDKLRHMNLTTVQLEGKKVVSKKTKLLNVKTSGKNSVAEKMVKEFSSDSTLMEVLTVVERDVDTYDAWGCMMCDSWKAESGADIAFENYGGVRYDYFPKGNFTKNDAIRLDPFGNEAVMIELTGEEIQRLILACRHADEDRFPIVSGMKYEVEFSKQDPNVINYINLMNEDGTPLDMKKTYKLVTNTYIQAICKFDHKNDYYPVGTKCINLMLNYLRKQKSIDYRDKRNVVVKESHFK